MNGRLELRGTLFGLALLLAACSSPSGPSEQAQAPAPEAKPEAAAPAPLEQAPAAEEPAVVEATPAAAAPSQETAPAAAPAPAAQTAAPAPAPATGPAPTAPVTTPAPAAAPAAASPLVATAPASTPRTAETTTATPAPAAVATPALADPGGSIAVPAAKPGLKRIGAEACGECHEVQFDSWASSGHAARTPMLDCEDCHGPGSEYKPMSVMKDPAKAKAAGLVTPDKAFCAQCHKKGVDDAFMKKAHAHEE
jgi:hypothetical protein